MIKKNTQRILRELPLGVSLVGASKTKSVENILEAVDGGLEIVGENYVGEAEEKIKVIGPKVRWHLIGHLQKNKVKKAVKLFDMIESVDSYELAREIDKRCSALNKKMLILIEVNSAREDGKNGVIPQEALFLIKKIGELGNVRVEGLMTMGPFKENPQEVRPFFKETRELFELVKNKNIPHVKMKYLSMGMSDSYKIAIEEGANLVRVGRLIFGERG